MGVNSLPKTVTRRRRDCDLNPGPSAPESSTLTTRQPSHVRTTRPISLLCVRTFQTRVAAMAAKRYSAARCGHSRWPCGHADQWVRLVECVILSFLWQS